MRSSVFLLQLMAVHHASCAAPHANPAQPSPEAPQHPASRPEEHPDVGASGIANLHPVKPLIPSENVFKGAQSLELAMDGDVVADAFKNLSEDKNISPEQFNEWIGSEMKSHKSHLKHREDKELLGVYNLMTKLDDMKLFKALSEKAKVKDNIRFVKNMAAIAKHNGISFGWFPFSEMSSCLIGELRKMSLGTDDLHKALKDISALCEEKCQEISATDVDDGFVNSFVQDEFLTSKLPGLLTTLENKFKKCYGDLKAKYAGKDKEDCLYIADCSFQTVKSMIESIIGIKSYKQRTHELRLVRVNVGVGSRPHSMQKKLSEVAIGMFVLAVGRNEKYYKDLESRTKKGQLSDTTVSEPSKMGQSIIMNRIKRVAEKIDKLEKNPSATEYQDVKNDMEALEKQLENAKASSLLDDVAEFAAGINEMKDRLQKVDAGMKEVDARSQPAGSVPNPEDTMNTLMMVLMGILFVSFLCLAIYTLSKASEV